MKNSWILRLIVLCGFMLLGARVSANPVFLTKSSNYIQATPDHSDTFVAIEVDEIEDILSAFFVQTSFERIRFSRLFISLLLMVNCTCQFLHSTPAFLRFQNFRL
jgi:hypothetical protein